jgi:hypothetical protein
MLEAVNYKEFEVVVKHTLSFKEVKVLKHYIILNPDEAADKVYNHTIGD